MNKKIISIILGVICLCCIFNVKAEKCDVNELYDLQTDAAKIKVERTVEIGENGEISCGDDPECNKSYDYYKIHILNLTDKYYLEIKNDFNDEIVRIHYDDIKDGEATFDWNNIMVITNFTIDVYSENSSTCSGNKITTLYLTTPRKNIYSQYSLCEGHEDDELCQEYVDYEEIDYDEFYEKIAPKEQNTIDTDKSMISKILDSYWTWIAVGVLVIGGGTFVIVRKRAVK